MISIYPGLMSNLLFVAGFGLLLTAISNRYLAARIAVAAAAIYFNLQYLAWRRIATLTELELAPSTLWFWTIFAFEVVAVVSVSWHFLVMTRRTNLSPRADEAERRLRGSSHVPSVDVFIVTVNEAREVLERTIRAARNLDYPSFQVFVLDDGGREWLRDLSRELGVEYISRESRKGFKAGNQNHALRLTGGDLILCLDADFAVKPEFLYRTVGLFEDESVAIVQTPQHFVNADPIQVNLSGASAWPEEQQVFTDVMLPARDAWGNAFCYGTNFVVKRRGLEEIGGFPEETICEDFYTSYLLKAKGYETRYLDEPLAKGLATESLAEFIKQRSRWCIGTLQCLYLKGGPLRARGLRLLDRLFFLDPMLFYVAYVYVFLMLLAPAVFWWTGVPPFNSELGHFLTMFAPRMGISMMALYWLTDRKVVPIVSEVGRIVGIFYFVRAVLSGLLRPFRQSFRVTLKGHIRDREIVQWRILLPHALLAIVTVAGAAFSFARPELQLIEWNQNVGLAIALTIYVLWMLFFAMMACVEPANPGGGLAAAPGVAEGGMAKSLWAIAKRIAR